MVELPTWKVDGRVSPIDAEKSARKDADDSLAILIDNIPLYLASVYINVVYSGPVWHPLLRDDLQHHAGREWHRH